MGAFKVKREIGGRTLSIETGRWAKQAAGAATVQYGETVVLATVVATEPRPGIDFFPLTVDYRERMYAAGKFPGGFIKREGRPTTKETLTMRLIDRPIRPLFPEGYRDDLLIQALCLSADLENDPDILAMNGAVASLLVSPLPYTEPVGAVRVGRIDGEFIINPTAEQLQKSELEITAAGHREAINMLEIGANEVPEDIIADGIMFAHEHIKQICDMMAELVDLAKPEITWTPPEPKAELFDKIKARAHDEFYKCKTMPGSKLERQNACADLRQAVTAEFCPEGAEDLGYDEADVFDALEKIEEEVVAELVLNEGRRPDGRALDEIRSLKIDVGVLPRTHGSAVFCRGETMSLAAATLGTARDEQAVDDLAEEFRKRFYLHYNFPSFSVGEVKMPRGPSRRDIGHGALAEKALQAVFPSLEDFPYTVRVVSDILESNGSSSMATVCGGTLCMMDAGVPIKDPVAGISIGMFHNDAKHVLLTDIAGEEDHYGDMDFKVAGTQNGITAIQLDLKVRGLSEQVIRETLEQAKQARMNILREMLQAIPQPREDISGYAPRLFTIKIDPEKIGKVIGPGGRGIRALEAETGATVDIEDDGTIQVACIDAKGAIAAKERIEAITEEVKVGRVYNGTVISIKDFGAFIEIIPGQDGLCHISELSQGYVKNVEDVVKVGDTLKVKVIAIDDQGRVKLSRKQVEEAGVNE